ncbi:M23 family metallopeptidase [Oceanotoga sp. DSM 15011]|uniref:Peptidase M23-like protein n=1 Tax=Oceanotoga teriensis TaxID=515440 RepID=A0AA45C5F2_9BACT|nr:MULTISPECIES: M23 family metallopeptidase [Oceanotoga]MDN5342297.1 hypothetical protein [Oceanotoga sp.]PWJ88750.1 peptidase M23-like protein [Oceanotoga teriensis]UYP00423.1 M23 family metallopeptidase [Oceanotoga sp. DSM 15011]
MRKIFILIINFLFLINIFASVFNLPIKDSYITSSFGEYRNTGNNPHFHMGIDFSTFNRENIDVLTAAEGYLEKVWINDPVYGNTIFIKHPDLGLTTVYAHLNSFSKKITGFTEQINEEFSTKRIEIIFPEEELKINKGEVIAYSGSTGEAMAPHLHFEVWEMKENGNIIRDALEYIEYKETREKNLELLSIRSNNKYFDIKKDEISTIEYSGDYPNLEIRVREKIGNNTTILPKKMSLYIDNRIVYKLNFAQIKEEEAYNPSVFGYGSTATVYWLKLYSKEALTPIEIDNWGQFIGKNLNNSVGKIELEDFWGNKEIYNIRFNKLY